uniref:Selenoprotein H n=1 Tax=Phasianus colchicus TaxID=9054 RepID=A0A669PMR1_PHACC
MAPGGRKRAKRRPAEPETQADPPEKRPRGKVSAAVAALAVEINPRQPRRNSFEVSLVKEDGSTVQLWSGIGKGPPRKLKFPEPTVVVEALRSSLA